MDDDDGVGLRTSKTAIFCLICVLENFFFSRHNAVDEKDRSTIRFCKEGIRRGKSLGHSRGLLYVPMLVVAV